MTAASGLLRQRFLVADEILADAPGFVFDHTRMPGPEIDRGTAVETGSFWDGSNAEIEVHYNIPEISGRLVSAWYRSERYRAHDYLQGGIGYGVDCQISGISSSGTSWTPTIQTGTFFDREHRLYLYGNDAVELIISGTELATVLPSEPANNIPVHLASWHFDRWSRPEPFESFNYRHMFTSTNSNTTLAPIPGTEPPLYESLYTNIRWQNVDTSGSEFLLDRSAPGIIRNRIIVSGVTATVLASPYLDSQFQLPLGPVVAIEGWPTIAIQEEPVTVAGGLATVQMSSASGLSDLTLAAVAYVRLSGTLAPDGPIVSAMTTVSGAYPATGTLLIDDGWSHQETIDYTSALGNVFSGLTRTSPTTLRDGSAIRLVTTSTISGASISGVTPDGSYVAYYTASGVPATLDATLATYSVPTLTGSSRAELTIDYERGLLCCYEPSGTAPYRTATVDVGPLANGLDHGLLWFATYPIRPASVRLQASRGINADGSIGPVSAGNDYVAFEARVLSPEGAPCRGALVDLVIDPRSREAGHATSIQSAVTDAAGVARFTYSPPGTITSLGHFAPSGSIVSSSGITFSPPILLEELWSATAGWTTELFAIYDDAYVPFSSTSGTAGYRADGRFEIVGVLSGTSPSTGFKVLKPLLPDVALDTNGATAVTSGTLVSTLVYPASSLPTDAEAFMTSVERHVSIGVAVSGAHVGSASYDVVVSIPEFMRGAFIFGEVTDPTTSSYDSLAYLTLNPFEDRTATEARSDPRLFGQVFHVRGTRSDEKMRAKFYVGINYSTLLATAAGRHQIRMIQGLRNKFIVET